MIAWGATLQVAVLQAQLGRACGFCSPHQLAPLVSGRHVSDASQDI
jgi:hypothetical protein